MTQRRDPRDLLIQPPYQVVHSVVHLGGTIESGERMVFDAQPQVPFRGRWLFTHDASTALWIHEIRVGNILVPTFDSPVPATFWCSAIYDATLQGLGLVTSAERLREIEQHPFFERLKLTFPTCSVSDKIAIRVENRGSVATTFKGTIAGHAIFRGGEPEGDVVRVDESMVREEPTVPEAVSGPRTTSVSGASSLSRRCWYCNAGVDEPCHGLPKGRAHEDRIR